MKKLFPEAPDVPQSVANRAVRIIEKHLRVHRVSRTSELPEEAKIRLYRDLRFYLEGGSQPPGAESEEKGFSLRRFLSRFWEKIEDFLSVSESCRDCGRAAILVWASFGESARLYALPWTSCSQTSSEAS